MTLFGWLIVGWLVIAAVAFGVLCFVDAPYGKQARAGWGPGVPNKLAWCLMEVVVLVTFYPAFWWAGGRWHSPLWAFAALLTLHYVNRSFVYPFRTRTSGKTMPLSIMLASVCFNSINGMLLGVDFARLQRDASWFGDWRFVVGLVVFLLGMGVNWHSDDILLKLRKPGETGYRIPRGGAFGWVGSPNLLGEIVEWAGFALLTWSLSGLAFFVWTCANLVPRARANDRWYRETFTDYPVDRKVLLPGLW